IPRTSPLPRSSFLNWIQDTRVARLLSGNPGIETVKETNPERVLRSGQYGSIRVSRDAADPRDSRSLIRAEAAGFPDFDGPAEPWQGPVRVRALEVDTQDCPTKGRAILGCAAQRLRR